MNYEYYHPEKYFRAIGPKHLNGLMGIKNHHEISEKIKLRVLELANTMDC